MDASGRFVRDRWDRDTNDSNAGYGITSVLEGGRLLEKAAVNVSVIGGTLSSARAEAMSSRLCLFCTISSSFLNIKIG